MDEPTAQIRKDKLSSSQFERLLLRLDPDRDRAGERYEELRSTLIRFFEWNSCPGAEDLADETLNRVAYKLEEQDIIDLGAFAWGVARNIRHEAYNKLQRLVAISELPNEGLSLFDGRDTEGEIQYRIKHARQLECLRECLNELSSGDQELFIAYYSPQEERARARRQLAQVSGLTISALRMKMIRIREKLEKCAARRMASSWRGPAGKTRRIVEDSRGNE